MSEDEFWSYQLDAFKRIYEFARRRVPFYLDQPDIYPPLSIQGEHLLNVLAELPVLKKQTVKERNSEFWPSPPLPLTTFNTTSGTTGTPLRLPATLQERAFGQAVYEEWLLRLCGKRIPRTIFLSGFMTPSPSGKDLFWFDPLSRQAYLSIYALNSANRDRILALFERLRPQLIYGYASAVHQLALLLEDAVQGIKDECIVIVTSEILQPHWRAPIENSLCRKAYNMYGSQEGSHLALQCRETRLHINPLYGVVEIVGEDGKAVQQGEAGSVLVTGLSRRSMPLIRYEIGDVAESTGYASDCPCGLEWPTIGSVEGRSEDLVVTRDGRRIGYLCFHATKDLQGIKEAQIMQKDYEKFVCNIVKSETESVASIYIEDMIRAQIRKRLQLDVSIEFRYFSSIPRGSRGKFKAVVVDFEEHKAI